MIRSLSRSALLAALAISIWTGCQRRAASVESGTVLPFIENDYGAALTAAKQSSRPLFVELWAPW